MNADSLAIGSLGEKNLDQFFFNRKNIFVYVASKPFSLCSDLNLLNFASSFAGASVFTYDSLLFITLAAELQTIVENISAILAHIFSTVFWSAFSPLKIIVFDGNFTVTRAVCSVKYIRIINTRYMYHWLACSKRVCVWARQYISYVHMNHQCCTLLCDNGITDTKPHEKALVANALRYNF